MTVRAARFQRRLSALSLSLVLAVGVFPAVASARETGLPLGPLVAKPGVSVAALFDTNVWRDQTAPEADFGLSVRPYLGLVFPGEDFRWTLDAYYRFFTFFNLGGRNHNDFRRVTQFGLGTSFDLGRRGKIGFYAAPRLFNEPANRGYGDGTEQKLGFALPLALRFRPTNAFQISVDGRWTWSQAYYSPVLLSPDPTVLSNRHEIAGGLGLDWRFFPRSHLLVSGEFGRILWGPQDEGQSSIAAQDPAWFWRAWAGVKGDLTRKLSVLALFGYGQALFAESAATPSLVGAAGLLGKAEIAVRPVQSQRLAVGFSRDFQFDYYASRIENTQAYFKYQGQFFSRLSASFDFSWTLRNLMGGVERLEHQWTAGLGLELMVVDFFHVEAAYRFSAVNPSSTNEGEYIDNLVTFGVTLGFK